MADDLGSLVDECAGQGLSALDYNLKFIDYELDILDDKMMMN